jgi:hypothetical protein
MEKMNYYNGNRRDPVEVSYPTETFEVMKEAAFVINAIKKNKNHVVLVELDADSSTRIREDELVRIRILGDYRDDRAVCLSDFWRAVEGIQAYNSQLFEHPEPQPSILQ